MRERAARLQARELGEPLAHEVETIDEPGALDELRQLVLELERKLEPLSRLEWALERHAQVGLVLRIVRAMTVSLQPQILAVAADDGQLFYIDVAVLLRFVSAPPRAEWRA